MSNGNGIQRVGDTAMVRHMSNEMAAWEAMREQADVLVRSGFLPKAIRTPEQALAIMQTGKELGLGPMQALRSIHIIEGKPTMSADLIAALVHSRLPGSLLRVTESTDLVCSIEAARPGREATLFSFSMEDAKRAGLTGKDNWRKFPRAMLRARCITETARAVFADCVLGMYDPDELGAVTDEAGSIVTVAAASEPTLSLSPHADSREEGTGDDDLFADLLHKLEAVKSEIPHCDSYDRAMGLRGVIGSGKVQSELLKRIQAGKESGALTPAMQGELGKLWQHCHRQVTKLEEKLKPSLEASFEDEEKPMREPGEDDE